MRLLVLPLTQLILSLYSTICKGFSPECIVSHSARLSASKSPTATFPLASASQAETDSQEGNFLIETTPNILYRMATLTDVSTISILLDSVFEDDEAENSSKNDETMTKTKTFMWDSLIEESSEPQLSREQKLASIEENLCKRMMDAKKEDAIPHVFLVATIPSRNEQGDDRVIGFLEMGAMPPPIPNSSKAECPYIGNVAVSSDVRRQKVGSTLVRHATKIAKQWCVPSSQTPFPPFLFLSVERDNDIALKFYERLGFEELEATTRQSIKKIYLAKELNN